jgi:spore coat-associated protein N
MILIHGLTRKALILAAGLALLGGTTALAASIGFTDARTDSRAVIVVANGAIHLSNSRAGKAVLVGLNMKPGGSVQGTVKIGARGTKRMQMSLRKSGVRENAGLAGGKLSQRMLLKVEWLRTGTRKPKVVYLGVVGAMRVVKLGTFKAGERRTYRLTAYFPDGGPAAGTTGDNAYMGANLSVELDWWGRALK